jgi:hypothetical protein
MIAHVVWWLGLAFVTAMVAGVTARLPVPTAPPGGDLPDRADNPPSRSGYTLDQRPIARPKLPQEIVDALAAVKYGTTAMPPAGNDRTVPISAKLVSKDHEWARALHAQPPFEIL